jgi:Tfp pilus assembly protein PilE
MFFNISIIRIMSDFNLGKTMKKTSFPRKQLGISIIEVMAALTILAIVTVNFLVRYAEYQRIETAESFGQEMARINAAFDRRLFEDGTDSSLWDTLVWPTEEVVRNNLFDLQLIGNTNAQCGRPAGWAPANPDIASTALVSCNFLRELPWDMTMSASLTEVSGIVREIYILFSFPNAQTLKDNIKYAAKSIKFSKKIDSPRLMGDHKYRFVDTATLAVYTSSVDCLANASTCGIQVLFDTTGTGYNSFLKVDGSNDMLAPISFRNGAVVQMCNRWTNTNGALNTWVNAPFECGVIGGGGEDEVQIVSDVVTGSEIVLNKICDINEKSSIATNRNRLNTGVDSYPCGLMNDGGIATLAVDNISTSNIFALEVVADNIITRGATSYGDVLLRQDNAGEATMITMESSTGRIMAEGYVTSNEDNTGLVGASEVRLYRYGLRGVSTSGSPQSGSIFIAPANNKSLNLGGFGTGNVAKSVDVSGADQFNVTTNDSISMTSMRNNSVVDISASPTGTGGQLNLSASSVGGEIRATAESLTVDSDAYLAVSTLGLVEGSAADIPERRLLVSKDYIDSAIRMVDMRVVKHNDFIAQPATSTCDGRKPLIVLTPLSMYTYSYDDQLGAVNRCTGDDALYDLTTTYERVWDTSTQSEYRQIRSATLNAPQCDKTQNEMVYSLYAVTSASRWQVKMFLSGWGGQAPFSGSAVAQVFCDKIR